MKIAILVSATALLAGCAHYDEDHQGRPATESGMERGTYNEPADPDRTRPNLNDPNERGPHWGGPGGLGGPNY
jgi:hypothetical protein